jgi:hypothetical protein
LVIADLLPKIALLAIKCEAHHGLRGAHGDAKIVIPMPHSHRARLLLVPTGAHGKRGFWKF